MSDTTVVAVGGDDGAQESAPVEAAAEAVEAAAEATEAAAEAAEAAAEAAEAAAEGAGGSGADQTTVDLVERVTRLEGRVDRLDLEAVTHAYIDGYVTDLAGMAVAEAAVVAEAVAEEVLDEAATGTGEVDIVTTVEPDTETASEGGKRGSRVGDAFRRIW